MQSKLVYFKYPKIQHVPNHISTRIIYYTPKQTSLPEDIWLSTLQYLDVNALVNFARTCSNNDSFVRFWYPNLLMGPKISNKCCLVL